MVNQAPAYKNRTYECTIWENHVQDTITEKNRHYSKIWSILDEWARKYEDGLIEYGALTLEESRQGRIHFQGFCTFSPDAYSDEESYRTTKEGKERFTPSNILRGSWRLVRSITGAQNYVVRSGIHAGKQGRIFSVEFGDFVDPAWNVSLKTRTLFELSKHLESGFTEQQVVQSFPLKVALIGEYQWKLLTKVHSSARRLQITELTPYYYIGRVQLDKEIEILNSHYKLDSP